MLAGSETGCKADFVVVEGVVRTPLGQKVALEIDILRIGSVGDSVICSLALGC